MKDYFQPESLMADWLSSQVLCWDLVCFKHLLNWLLARLYSSVIPFSWVRSLMFHRSSLVNRGLALLFFCHWVFFWNHVSSKTEIYRSRQHLWRRQNCHSHILGPPSSADAVSESPPTVSGVQLQIVLQIYWAVFTFCLDVRAVWDIVWGCFPWDGWGHVLTAVI